MSITTAGCPGAGWQLPRPDRVLERIRTWLEQRRQVATQRLLDPRLQEDAGLPRDAYSAPTFAAADMSVWSLAGFGTAAAAARQRAAQQAERLR